MQIVNAHADDVHLVKDVARVRNRRSGSVDRAGAAVLDDAQGRFNGSERGGRVYVDVHDET